MRIENSKQIQLELINLIKLLFTETNPIPIKKALNLIGFNVGVPRLPLVEASDSLSHQLYEEMKLQKII